ncbi:hypothetical protein OAQ99_04560 [Candidatus Kapabacteria bacterium]|nr:hypothetical protein [Candidatus Kapabacteria bacterium]
MQYTLNKDNLEDTVKLEQRLEILVSALRGEAIEVIENINGDLLLEIYSLKKNNLLIESIPPFNCRPYRDSLGRLHETKYLKITPEGKYLLRELLFDLKERYKKSA